MDSDALRKMWRIYLRTAFSLVNFKIVIYSEALVLSIFGFGPAPSTPAVSSFLLVQGLLLGLLVALLAVGVTSQWRFFVMMALLVFLLQVWTFVAVTVGEILAGALARGVHGVLMFAVAFILVRVYRRLLARMDVETSGSRPGNNI